jgi:Winged helix-turn helix
MSKKEFDRLEVLLGIWSGRLRVADACELLNLKRRQVVRLLARLKHSGAASLVSKRRGRPSNNRLPEANRDLALSLVRERYADFGPTLAAEKLAEVHGCAISRETFARLAVASATSIRALHCQQSCPGFYLFHDRDQSDAGYANGAIHVTALDLAVRFHVSVLRHADLGAVGGPDLTHDPRVAHRPRHPP